MVDSPGAIAVAQVRFPRLSGMPALGGREELAVPRWMGESAGAVDAALRGAARDVPGRLDHRRGLVPPWLLRTSMWVWNRGRSPGVVPPTLALQGALGLHT